MEAYYGILYFVFITSLLMKKLLSLLVLTFSLFLVWCWTSWSVRDISSDTESEPTENVVVEQPAEEVVEIEEPKEFDPDTFEDQEIDELIGLLEWLVEW